MLAGKECVQYRPDSTKFNWMSAEIERNGSPLVWSLLDTDPLPIDVFLALNHRTLWLHRNAFPNNYSL